MTIDVQDLSVTIAGRTVVDRVSFKIQNGQRFGVIGQSGSGKSLTALALVGLLPQGAVASGSVNWTGHQGQTQDLLRLSERNRAGIRGSEIGFVFQDPLTSLNPLRTVGRQVAESIKLHEKLSRSDLRQRTLAEISRVRLDRPEDIVRRYPHQLSGGQRQRIALAMALAPRPQLLIADEPTTALDVTVQAEILQLLLNLVEDQNMSLLFITHDLAVLSAVASEAMVLENGQVVETAPTSRLLTNPQARHTRALLNDARATQWQPPPNPIGATES